MENKNYIEKIKKEYTEIAKETTKLDTLKSMDNKVKRLPNIFAYTYGSVSTLIFGTGMCLAMNIIGKTTAWTVIGIIAGVIGIGLCTSTYFIYKKMLKNRKAKYSKEILDLANDLLNEEK